MKLILGLIRLYQRSRWLYSPLLKGLYLSDGACRYQPTCSHYCYQAIAKYGTLKGVFLGIKRIIRCHPWAKGGSDPLK